MRNSATAVLMMAYGGPETLEEVEPYLLKVRGGRPTPSALVEEVRDRYRQIGGGSPLLRITEAQAQALEAELVRQGHRFPVYVGMRHWRPEISSAIARMLQDGVEHAVALCTAPHYSGMSVGAYFEMVAEAIQNLEAELDLVYVRSWHDHPLLIRAIAEKVEGALSRFPSGTRSQVEVIFTAHSLPARILQEGDPYPDQLAETVAGVVQRLGLKNWQFCYQSAGRTDDAWLGPAVEDVVIQLADEGRKEILVAPVGFVADHVEVLYDIDIVCRAMAADRGARLERTESLNTTPTFIAAMASVVLEAVASR